MAAPAPEAATGAAAIPAPAVPASDAGPLVAAAAGRRLAEAAAVLVMVGWAANFVIVKSAIASVPPVAFAFLRYALAGAVVLVLARWREGSLAIPWPLLRRVLLLGGLGFGAYQVLWTSALSGTSAGNSSLLVATAPIWTALLAATIGSEAGSRVRLLGGLVSLAGVGLVVASNGLRLDSVGLGDLVTLVAAACWGSYLALSAPLLDQVSPLLLTAWAIVGGVAVLAIPGLLSLSGAGPALASPGVLASIAYSGILAAGLSGIVVARAVAAVGATRVANLQFLVPALTVVLAALFLGEPVLPLQVAGGIVIVAGIVLSRRTGSASGPAVGSRAALPFVEAP